MTRVSLVRHKRSAYSPLLASHAPHSPTQSPTPNTVALRAPSVWYHTGRTAEHACTRPAPAAPRPHAAPDSGSPCNLSMLRDLHMAPRRGGQQSGRDRCARSRAAHGHTQGAARPGGQEVCGVGRAPLRAVVTPRGSQQRRAGSAAFMQVVCQQGGAHTPPRRACGRHGRPAASRRVATSWLAGAAAEVDSTGCLAVRLPVDVVAAAGLQIAICADVCALDHLGAGQCDSVRRLGGHPQKRKHGGRYGVAAARAPGQAARAAPHERGRCAWGAVGGGTKGQIRARPTARCAGWPVARTCSVSNAP